MDASDIWLLQSGKIEEKCFCFIRGSSANFNANAMTDVDKKTDKMLPLLEMVLIILQKKKLRSKQSEKKNVFVH